jgi:hypothetical protein
MNEVDSKYDRAKPALNTNLPFLDPTRSGAGCGAPAQIEEE